jgi:hypothetical protein
MTIRRLAIAGAAMALIALGGCTESGGSPTAGGGATAAATTAPATPAAELEEAAGKLGDIPVKIDLTAIGGITVGGAFDAKNQLADMSTDLGSLGTMNMRQVGNDLYVKVSGTLASSLSGDAKKKWMHIDVSKVAEDSALNIKNNDPKATAKILTSAAEVKKTGNTSFAGTADLTKSPTFDASTAQGLGDKMKAVPFTAKTDAEGRLVELTFDLAAVAPGGGEMITKYSELGVPVKVTAPAAADVVEMPADFAKAMAGA